MTASDPTNNERTFAKLGRSVQTRVTKRDEGWGSQKVKKK